jgi:hypothetical protein
MSETDEPKPPKVDRNVKPPSAEDIEAAEMARLCREAVEVVGADAIMVVWTKQRRRKTTVYQTSLGNGLTVVGLMRWVAAKVEEMDDPDDDEEDDDGEDDED